MNGTRRNAGDRPSCARSGGGPARAFSVVELLMVLAIVTVFAGIAVPRYASAERRSRADAAAARVRLDIALARTLARTTGAPTQILFNPATDSYEIPGATPLDAGSAGLTVPLGERPYGVDLASADFAGLPTLEFNGFGDLVEPGAVLLKLGDEMRRVVVTAEGVEIEVEIEGGGLVNEGGGAMIGPN